MNVLYLLPNKTGIASSYAWQRFLKMHKIGEYWLFSNYYELRIGNMYVGKCKHLGE